MNISVVLLAGGESRRIGRDKATIVFRKRPLWEDQLELLRRLRPWEVFVSARREPPWRPSDVEFVPDDPPSRGPLSGLTATLTRIATDHLLVVPIDTPFVTEEYLRRICRLIAPGQGVVPMLNNRLEPLIAIYPIQAKEELTAALSRNELSLQSILKKLIEHGRMRTLETKAEDAALFRNLNKPADLVENID